MKFTNNLFLFAVNCILTYPVFFGTPVMDQNNNTEFIMYYFKKHFNYISDSEKK